MSDDIVLHFDSGWTLLAYGAVLCAALFLAYSYGLSKGAEDVAKRVGELLRGNDKQ